MRLRVLTLIYLCYDSDSQLFLGASWRYSNCIAIQHLANKAMQYWQGILPRSLHLDQLFSRFLLDTTTASITNIGATFRVQRVRNRWLKSLLLAISYRSLNLSNLHINSLLWTLGTASWNTETGGTCTVIYSSKPGNASGFTICKILSSSRIRAPFNLLAYATPTSFMILHEEKVRSIANY